MEIYVNLNKCFSKLKINVSAELNHCQPASSLFSFIYLFYLLLFPISFLVTAFSAVSFERWVLVSTESLSFSFSFYVILMSSLVGVSFIHVGSMHSSMVSFKFVLAGNSFEGGLQCVLFGFQRIWRSSMNLDCGGSSNKAENSWEFHFDFI